MNFLNRFNIGTRLGVGFATVLLLLVGLTAIGIVKVNAINAGLAAINDLNSVKQRYAINFRGSVHDRAISLRDVTLVADAASLATVLAGIDRLQSDYTKSAERMDKLFAERKDISADEVRILTTIKETEARTLPLIKQVVASQQAGATAGAKEVLMRDARPAFTEWLARINQFIDLQEALNQRESAQARQTAQGFQTIMVVLCLGAIVVCAGASYVITLSLTRPVGEAIRASEQIATGDLRFQQIESGTHETARLLQSLSRMSGNLDGIVAQVREASDSVAAGSQQIATGNADLSLRTEKQAASLQETASSLRDLTATVRRNEETAREANALAASASETAAAGGKSMTQVVVTMEGISVASKKIADIISVIDGIAFQTNILALNAAVEAARAGEQGRGFAVVASEVRSLAQRSAGAAKDIKTLITDSVDRVEAGSRQVSLAGRNMDDIVAQVGKVCALIGEISRATGAQSLGIGHVGEAIDTLDQVTHQNAALVEQSAAAAENLKLQASRLLGVVSVFKLSGNRVAA